MMSRASRILKWVGAGTVLLAAAPIAYAEPPASVPAAPGPFAGSCGVGPESRADGYPAAMQYPAAMLPWGVRDPARAAREAGGGVPADGGVACAGEHGATGVPRPAGAGEPSPTDAPEYAGTVTVTLPGP